MDTRRLLTTMLIVGAMLIGFQLFFNRGGPPAGTPGAPGASPMYAPIPQGIPPLAEGDTKPETIVLGDPESLPGAGGTKVSLTVNTQTAGVDLVQLNKHDFAETVKRDKPLILLQAEPGLARPFATVGIHLYIQSDTATALKLPLDAFRSVEDFVELPFGWVLEQAKEPKDAPPKWRHTRWVGYYEKNLGAEELEQKRKLETVDSGEAVNAANNTFLLWSQYVWKVTRRTTTEVDLTMTLAAGPVRLAEVTKTYQLDPVSYEVKISHTVKNLSNGIIRVQVEQLGPGELPRDDPQADDRFYLGVGLNSTKKYIEPLRYTDMHAALTSIPNGSKLIGQMRDFSKDPLLYVASCNRFFAAIVRPLPMADPPKMYPLATGRELMEVHHVDSAHLDVMRHSSHAPDARGILRLTGSAVAVGPGNTAAMPLTAFLGPKKRDLLDGNPSAPRTSDEYAHLAYEYKSVIQLATGCYANCTWEFLALWILALLNFFVKTVAFGNYGVAIMVLVIVVRALLHPLTRSSQIQMATMGKKMKDVQPLLEAIKKKYPNNKQKQTEEQMRIYKEHKVNPAGGLLGCLPMLIQMPIWAALWSGLRTDIDLRHQAFIPGWINDLSHPDTVWPTTIPVIGKPLFSVWLLGDIYGLNLLPLLLTAVFFFQMKVSMASQPKPADEQQAQMQKMSQYMIFIFPLFLYSAPSGLNLYIFASTLGGLVDTWLVRKTLKKRGILPATAQTLPTHEEKP